MQAVDDNFKIRMDFLYSPCHSYRKEFTDTRSTFKTAHRDLVIKLLESLNIKSNILAVGCSTGTEILLIQEKYPNVIVTGVEIVLSQVEIARKRTNATIYHASASDIPLKSHSQDAIIAIDCAYHFYPSRPPFLKECKRLLTNQGQLGLVDLYFSLW